MRREDDIGRVESFSKPTLLFMEEGSSRFLHETVDVLAAEFPQSRVEIL